MLLLAEDDGWPAEDFTLAENLEDLQRHEKSIRLENELGETTVSGQGMLDARAWHWADKA